jgi:hypothetical protein
LAFIVLAIALTYSWRTSLFVNTYQLNVNIRGVGQSSAARTFVLRTVASSGNIFEQRDLRPGLLAYRSTDRNALAQIPALLGARYDVRTGGPGRVDFDKNTQIVISGPFLLFGATDAAVLVELALLFFAFAYPSGMDAVFVFGRVALIGAAGAALIALRQQSEYPLLPGYIAILLLANVALVRWLWVSRDKWPGALRTNYFGIIAVLAAVDIANAVTLLPK